MDNPVVLASIALIVVALIVVVVKNRKPPSGGTGSGTRNPNKPNRY